MLFTRGTVGRLAVKNRIVRAATGEAAADDATGAPTPQMQKLYEELACGGAGTLVTGFAYVSAAGKPIPCAAGLHTADVLPAHAALADAVHAQDARIVCQLVYGGSKSVLPSDDPRRLDAGGHSQATAPTPNADVAGPCALPHPATGIVPHEATPEELAGIAADFAAAAVRAREAGYDAVELHAGHGYLVAQFLDGRFNKRADAYGGTLENRSRLACECLAAMRQATGPDFPLWVKLNCCDDRTDPDGARGGLSLAESAQAAELMVEAGANAVEVSGDWHAYRADEVEGDPFFGDYAVRLAEALAGRADVLCTGGWRDPLSLETYLAMTKVAACGLCRPLICEPDLPARWKSGDLSEARCTSCGRCLSTGRLACVLNG